MEAEIISLIAQHLNMPTSEIRADSHLINDLGMSSLDIMHIVSVVEDRYGIEINEYDILGSLTVGKISEYLATIINP